MDADADNADLPLQEKPVEDLRFCTSSLAFVSEAPLFQSRRADWFHPQERAEPSNINYFPRMQYSQLRCHFVAATVKHGTKEEHFFVLSALNLRTGNGEVIEFAGGGKSQERGADCSLVVWFGTSHNGRYRAEKRNRFTFSKLMMS